jgi:Fe-S-cluster-containing hydrogenase component 2
MDEHCYLLGCYTCSQQVNVTISRGGAHNQILVSVMTYGFAIVGRPPASSLKSVCAKVCPATGISKYTLTRIEQTEGIRKKKSRFLF